jgi:tRNA(fMet)-specific endonuclease VapC
MGISAVTLGELVFGAEHSQQVERNLADIEAMIARLEVLPFDIKAAYHFGQIRAALYAVGAPMGPFDMMIAGHARAYGLTLVTNNVHEFGRVQGLLIENWIHGTA